MQMKTKAGLPLVALGLCVLAAWSLWTKTRNLRPVDVPVSLPEGNTVSQDFKLNLDGLYLIEISADKNISPDKARCLLGIAIDTTRCDGVVPAIAVNWSLFRDGQEIRRGTSAEPHSAPVDNLNIVRVIGEFPGQAGQQYRLQVTNVVDGRSLDPAHPRLRVAISSLMRTDFQSAGVLVFSISFICAMFGTILLAIAFFTRRTQ